MIEPTCVTCTRKSQQPDDNAHAPCSRIRSFLWIHSSGFCYVGYNQNSATVHWAQRWDEVSGDFSNFDINCILLNLHYVSRSFGCLESANVNNSFRFRSVGLKCFVRKSTRMIGERDMLQLTVAVGFR